jgi:hypothetical protein
VLREDVADLLGREGFVVLMPRPLPGNEAALCVGPAVAIAARAATA